MHLEITEAEAETISMALRHYANHFIYSDSRKTLAALATRIEKARPDADLAEAAEGFTCGSCGRPEIECSREPCPAVLEDREE